jgi:nicotinamide-nucleotide amidase
MEGVCIGTLITGNEILYGKTKDTNGVFFAQELLKVGVRVQSLRVEGDFQANILRALNELFETCDVVLMTGGLGPTSDDLTAQIVAQFVNEPLVFFHEAWGMCLNYFKKLGRTEIPESNRKQAFLPKNALLLPNSLGTAAGFFVKFKNKFLYCLPGVPAECEAMFLDSVLPQILQLVPATHKMKSASWQIVGVGESFLQTKLDDFEKKHSRFQISYQAHAGYVTYTLSALENELNSLHDTWLQEIDSELKEILGAHVLFLGSESLSEKLEKMSRVRNFKKEAKETSVYHNETNQVSITTNILTFEKGFEVSIHLENTENKENSPNLLVSEKNIALLKQLGWNHENSSMFTKNVSLDSNAMGIPSLKQRVKNFTQAAVLILMQLCIGFLCFPSLGFSAPSHLEIKMFQMNPA